MLSISKIRDTFNPFLRKGQKLFEAHVVDALVKDQKAPHRMTGISSTNYRKLSGKHLDARRKIVKKKIHERFHMIFQRRHDCIHNCDRPKLKLLELTSSSTQKILDDVRLLIEFCDSHFEKEFNLYLSHVGANSQTRNATGYVI